MLCEYVSEYFVEYSLSNETTVYDKRKITDRCNYFDISSAASLEI